MQCICLQCSTHAACATFGMSNRPRLKNKIEVGICRYLCLLTMESTAAKRSLPQLCNEMLNFGIATQHYRCILQATLSNHSRQNKLRVLKSQFIIYIFNTNVRVPTSMHFVDICIAFVDLSVQVPCSMSHCQIGKFSIYRQQHQEL